MAVDDRPTVKVSNIPFTATAKDLLDFFESTVGPNSVFACEIFSEHKNWKSRGFGRVQFESIDAKLTAIHLSLSHSLLFKGSNLSVSCSHDDIIVRPVEPKHSVDKGILHVGFLETEECMCVLEKWEGVKMRLMPERKRIEFWVKFGGECYKLEVGFDDVFEANGCCLEDKKLNAVLLKLKHAPKIYQKISGPNVTSNFRADRYHFCKEDFEYTWVRTTDFSPTKSIGQSSSFCWEIQEESSLSEIFSKFPYYKQEIIDLNLEEGAEFLSQSELVPLVEVESDSKLSHEILFQLNSLLHSQKISLAAIESDLVDILCNLAPDTCILILQQFHKLKSTCYRPIPFIRTQLHIIRRNSKNLLSSSQTRLTNQNTMNCHRALVTPTKIYCVGPELETANYVVKNFASHASDFLRVTFVEEDWSKLPANAISTSIQQGFLSRPYRTKLYARILSVLRDGIVIGSKRFEFLAFSASQLRSNSVWMFASNDEVKAADIREWMGSFNKIRSVSKCAARMGQLFSSSTQTLVVPVQHVEMVPDVEVTSSDGVNYCFSDGIGKISLSFARQVSQKCGLNHTPSAFQIRYGGYKGVVAVDRNSFRKLSLRSSMLKFESKNRMLNVTSWSESMPCFLNREIITLLSTLGIEDDVFLEMQTVQVLLLDKMVTSKESALDFLESLGKSDTKNILVKMLQGYEPNLEPYLSMMLQSYREYQLSDIRSRCRIFVPNGRILIGCLDETGILSYGQVYVRVTITKRERGFENQSFYKKVDETTAIVLGKVLVTKNPCLHPGDIRVLEAVYEVALEEKGLVDCLIFPQKGERPHPNECSGGDLDGDLFFISWDENLIPSQTEAPMDYTARRPRIMDHDVTLQEIQKFFVDYMINDTLGTISTAHLIHADSEPNKAQSPKCLQLATLHSMAVDFAKTGAPAEMPRVLKPREYPDFMERTDRPSYTSNGVLGKLYRATLESKVNKHSHFDWSNSLESSYDLDLLVDDFESFIEIAEIHRELYIEKITTLMNFYGAEREDEIVTGNLRVKSAYLQRDNRRYGEMKDRILVSMKGLYKEAKGWFESSCTMQERQKMASAWYYVTYHPSYCREGLSFLSFPWIVGDILMNIKFVKSRNLRCEYSHHLNMKK